MARLIMEGLTIEQAKELASWYEGQGEQDADIWFECQEPPIKAPMADCRHEGGYVHVDKDNETVVLYCK